MGTRLLKNLLIAGVLTAGSFVWADETKKFSKAAGATAEDRKHAVLVEIKKLPNHAWAGDYYAGDGTGVNRFLAIAPQAGFVFEWRGCLGMYDRNYGKAEEVDGTLNLEFTFKNERKGLRGVAPALVPVAWGERRYLVPTGEMIDLCNAVNQGTEPRDSKYGRFLLRVGDEKKKVRGLPEVPAEYKPYIVAKPITAKISSVGSIKTRTDSDLKEFRRREVDVTIDAGRQSGVFVGMELSVTNPSHVLDDVTIAKVEETHSSGTIVQLFSKDDAEPLPEVGWQLSSRRFEPEAKDQ
jgi:hypothetical protein